MYRDIGSRTITCLVALLASCQWACAKDAPQFAWSVDLQRGTADLNVGAQPVVRYMFAHDFSTPARRDETYKVFQHVFAPGTGKLITKGAGGDYPHHRGIFLGFRLTKYQQTYTDFWHCKPETQKDGGSQQHVRFLETAGDARHGTMTAEIHWINAAGKVVIAEKRTLTAAKLPVDQPPGYGWQIDIVSQLESRQGPVTLDGDRQHAGLQFRAAQVVAKENSARYVRPAGFPEQEKAFEVEDNRDPDKHVNLGWLAMTYPVEGETVAVQYCEDPALPKPSRYSERPYGRFGAFFKAQLSPETPLTLRYRLLVTTGAIPSRDVLQSRYDTFVKSLIPR